MGGQHPGGSTRGEFGSNLDLVLNQGAHLTHLVHATSASCIFIISVMCLSWLGETFLMKRWERPWTVDSQSTPEAQEASQASCQRKMLITIIIDNSDDYNFCWWLWYWWGWWCNKWSGEAMTKKCGRYLSCMAKMPIFWFCLHPLFTFATLVSFLLFPGMQPVEVIMPYSIFFSSNLASTSILLTG